jgi:hypothetical protein
MTAENKNNKKNTKNKEKDIDVEKEEVDSDTEMAVLPMTHFNALIANKDEVIEKYDSDRFRLAAELKAERETKMVYIKAHQKEQNLKREFQQKCEIQEKELIALKNKTKPNTKVSEILSKSKPVMDVNNREDLLDQYYKKHYASDIEKLKKDLGVE